jgi:hypothetical protein
MINKNWKKHKIRGILKLIVTKIQKKEQYK